MTNQKETICGIHPVAQILRRRSRTVFTLFVEDAKITTRISQIIKLAKRQNIKILKKDKKALDRLSARANHQGAVAYVEPLNKLTLHEAILRDKKNKKSIWLAVDEITDPQNLGTMIRTAVSFGVNYIVLPQHRTAGITSVVSKAACGAMEDINIVEVSNLNWAILTLKEKGYWVYGTGLEGEPMQSIGYNAPCVLVIGSEGKGMRQLTGKNCDVIIKIEQTSKTQSLNAACASAVVLYDMFCKIKLEK